MNDITEENENRKMNTDTLENEGTSLPEITGEESMEELLGIYESSLKKF